MKGINDIDYAIKYIDCYSVAMYIMYAQLHYDYA